MATRTRASTPDSYMELIAQFPLRRIRSAAEHAAAKKLILGLSAITNDQGAADYLDVLIDLVAEYERQRVASFGSSISIAELLRHRMHERGLSASALARQIGVSQSNLSEMLNGRRDWSKTAIRGLGRLFNIRAERFLA